MISEKEDEKFRLGINQFNAQRFFEAHETWEELWLHTPEPEKTFLQGIIQIAASFHHYLRHNFAGAETLLADGIVKLSRFPAQHRGLELADLRTAAKRWARALGQGKDPGRAELPRIEWARSGASGARKEPQ